MPVPDEDSGLDANADRREKIIRRVCGIMGWPYKTSPVWGVLRKIALAEAIAVGLDKLEEVVARLEAIAALRHGCLAALGFLGGVSILSKEALQKVLVDAVKASESPLGGGTMKKYLWTLETLLAWMQEKSSSVSLNWGEDNGCWEASWITGGERCVGVSKDPLSALCEALSKAMDQQSYNDLAASGGIADAP